jgi:hypothetical protein
MVQPLCRAIKNGGCRNCVKICKKKSKSKEATWVKGNGPDDSSHFYRLVKLWGKFLPQFCKESSDSVTFTDTPPLQFPSGKKRWKKNQLWYHIPFKSYLSPVLSNQLIHINAKGLCWVKLYYFERVLSLFATYSLGTVWPHFLYLLKSLTALRQCYMYPTAFIFWSETFW